MKIEITILTAPISVSVAPASPMVAELGGIGTLIVNNYYSEGGAGGYILTEADKAEIAALARYDDTEIRELIAQIQGYDDTALRQEIDQAFQQFGASVGQQLSAISQDVGTIGQQAQQNASAIESINTSILQISEIAEAAAQNSQDIGTINGTIGDIATVLDALNGEVV